MLQRLSLSIARSLSLPIALPLRGEACNLVGSQPGSAPALSCVCATADRFVLGLDRFVTPLLDVPLIFSSDSRVSFADHHARSLYFDMAFHRIFSLQLQRTAKSKTTTLAQHTDVYFRTHFGRETGGKRRAAAPRCHRERPRGGVLARGHRRGETKTAVLRGVVSLDAAVAAFGVVFLFRVNGELTGCIRFGPK